MSKSTVTSRRVVERDNEKDRPEEMTVLERNPPDNDDQEVGRRVDSKFSTRVLGMEGEDVHVF